MTRPLALAVVSLGALAPGAAAAPRVTTMVVGPKATLYRPHPVVASATRVRVGRRSCAVRGATALAVLAAADRRGGPGFRTTDDGACGALFVDRVARAANRGRDGWSYKVGHRTPQSGASTRTGIRSGSRVVWFYCRLGSRGCQRSLEISGPARAAASSTVTLTVRAYDDLGRGGPARGATVRLARASGRTDARGRVTLPAPSAPRAYAISATRRGLVPAFPERIAIG